MAKKEGKGSRTERADSPRPGSAAEMKKFRAEQDLRTLRESESVKSDPSRLRAAKKIAREEVKALRKIGS